MNNRFILVITSFLGSIISLSAQNKPQPAPEVIVTDNYFGKIVSDPYRYLENLNDPKVIDWMKSNADYAREKLNEIPERENLIKKIKELSSRRGSTISELEITENNKYFYLKRNVNDENAKLYYKQGYEGAEILLFDPVGYKKANGVTYNISTITPNIEGDKVAIQVSPNGSESGELFIIDINGKTYPETFDRCWSSYVSWFPDGNSFTFTRLNSSDVKDVNRSLNTKVYYHKLGQTEKEDVEFLSNVTNPELNIRPEEAPYNIYQKNSKNYALLRTVDARIRLYTSDFNNNPSPTTWKSLVTQEDEVVRFRTDNEFIYYLTFKNAANFKIIKVPLSSPEIENAITVVKEPKNGNITNFAVTKDGLYYSITENGIEAKAYFLAKNKTNPIELKLPFQAGSVSFSNISMNKSDIWMTIEGWTSQQKRYFYNPITNTFTFQPLTKPIEYPEFEDIISKEIMIPSYDGVMVPVSLIYNKNIKLNGDNPVLIGGYGSYGSSMEPYFSPGRLLPYCLYGGIYVVAHVRGGGELGDKWYKAGFKETKPNTWKDLIATAEYLINKKYTTSKKIAIRSESAGGILIGRAITERPDLFAASIIQAGSLNAIRSEIQANGPANIPEFGTVKDPKDFKALLEMDAFHHIVKGTAYPATLVTAGINDPRVTAWEPAKFAALLQTANSSDKQILFFTDFEAGHGIGNSKSKNMEISGDIISFAYANTGHPKFQISKK
ncbi:prolyl oligopeptidase family serine peptidase [Flavobacterium sp. LC2016-01]|uniref:prolyl oligopeptidase family serine peptidase n=1 Tax=Flavobacterium sp. LC2016-01 TaxID=2675876 RepID=UPI0012BADA46|nr:prolyl oligopeptidase family serine peptidase [Flavobacterium sp. LC2016-01]MTH14011.1 prolyl oligopeptidase family serine peptidase [Flavobacterium sp. LC2016-01]